MTAAHWISPETVRAVRIARQPSMSCQMFFAQALP